MNVLDPDVHKDAEKTTKTLTFKNNRTEFESSDIILDTFAIADKAEDVDYSLSYNFTKGTVVVQLLKDLETDSLECTYNTVDTSAVESDDIIGQETADGQYTGCTPCLCSISTTMPSSIFWQHPAGAISRKFTRLW